MLRAFIVLILLSSHAQAQIAVWGNKTYTSAVCSSPNCVMCQNIRAQLSVPLTYNTQLVPTPMGAVRAILAELNPNNREKLFDVGCGDGRFLIEASKRYGCTSIGIELNAKSAAIARQNAINEYVSPLVLIFKGDAQMYDISEADYLTAYLYPELLEKLVAKLKPGCKVASYLHDIPTLATTKYNVDGYVFYVGVKQ